MVSFTPFIVATLWSAVVQAVSLPTCQATAPQIKNLTSVRTAYTSLLPGSPFDVLFAKEKDRAFVSAGAYLSVLDTSTFPPSIFYNLPLSIAGDSVDAALGMTFDQSGKYILVTTDSNNLTVVDAEAAIAGNSSAVLGYVVGVEQAGDTDIEVSSDGTYAFVSQEYGSSSTEARGTVEVYRVVVNNNGTVSGKSTGYIELGHEVVGTAFNFNKTVLYATSEQSLNGTSCIITGGSVNFTVVEGALSVLGVKELETSPKTALKSQAYAGYSPVRALVSPNEKLVWTAARESNHLLAFDTQKLSTDPSKALLASVQVGTSPIDLTYARNYSLMITADSNRYDYTLPTMATAGLGVVDVRAALDGKPSVLGSIPTGYFPRAFSTSPDGKTILVALYSSNRIQAIDVSTLPSAST